MPTLDQFNAYQKGTTSICMIAKIEATPERGGDIKRFALHAEDIEFDGETYEAVAFDVSTIQVSAGTEINNATFATMLNQAVSRLNIRGGKWQGAKVQLTIVDFNTLEIGYLERHNGRFGQATIIGKEAEFEYRGLMQILAQEIGDRTSRLCRYTLGGAKCTKNLEDFTFTGEVTAVGTGYGAHQRFTINVSKDDGYFYKGEILWTSGNNDGLKMEVQNNDGQEITLLLPMLKAVQVGDEFSIIAGDDKRIETCHGKFNNAINFGGEPCIPPKDKIFKFPDL